MSDAQGAQLTRSLDELLDLRVLLFGGKGGVGKTTLSVIAALHASTSRRVILFSSDPASNLRDIIGEDQPGIVVEQLDAATLYQQFLDRNLPSILELADRGTYLEKEEARRFFELALPGVDELMAWRYIGQLAERDPDALVIVDTAPTGHTLRMLSSSRHFEQLIHAFELMQRKHKDLIEQFARRTVRDEIDTFIERFDSENAAHLALLRNSKQTAFVPVTVAEPLIIEQTRRLADAVRNEGIAVPFIALNRVAAECDCDRCRANAQAEKNARTQLAPDRVIDVPRACRPLDSPESIRAFLGNEDFQPAAVAGPSLHAQLPLSLPLRLKLVFFAGKGGVGKTTVASSVALQVAEANPEKQYVIVSVDPAHALPHLLNAAIPPNLSVEIVDTRRKWAQLRETIGSEIQRVFDALTPRGMTIAHDSDVLAQLIDVAPPGADEIFAVMRLAKLTAGDAIETVFVDTAPTGHFLRLIDLPETAGEWVREFMRLLLRYRQLVPPGSLGEELLDASRALTAVRELIRSSRATTVLVTRPERIVIEETLRLREALEQREISIGATVANYITPANDCSCDAIARSHEARELARLGAATIIERSEHPPAATDLRELVALVQTPER